MKSVAATKRLIYRGPFREVVDDDGHVLRRGVRTAVCEKTFGLRALIRHPRETKGDDYTVTTSAVGPTCSPNGTCC